VFNTDGVITAICVILMYTADYRSWPQITLLQKAWSTATAPWNTTVNSSHDFTVWRVDRVTSWLVPAPTRCSASKTHGPRPANIPLPVREMRGRQRKFSSIFVLLVGFVQLILTCQLHAGGWGSTSRTSVSIYADA